MKKSNRYATTHLSEDQFEPGSRGRVLKNLLHVTSKRKMDEQEWLAFVPMMNNAIHTYLQDHRFTSADICGLHKSWLGGIYSWAGMYRNVNISKGGFNFAAARHIPALMDEFKKKQLTRYTPCTFTSESDIVHAIAETHVELVLIHPFREGNGRIARLLSILMALQAGLPPLDFSIIKGNKLKAYFNAVHAGLDRNYRPMEKIFSEVISWTARVSKQE